jgi:hypothetical protein
LALLIVASIVHRVVRAARGGGVSREHLSPLVFAAASLLFSIVLWWSNIYEALVAYLSPSLVGGWAQLSQLLDLSSASKKLSGIHAPFAGAQNPIYETVAGLLFPLVVLVIFLMSVAILWRNRRRFESVPWAFAVLGAMFFLSLPMALTGGGGEGAHRSWGYSFIGIAVLCGLAWSLWVPHAVVPRFGALGRSVARLAGPRVRIGIIVVALIVLYVGGAAVGTNVSARFPGSPNVGDDARSVSRESGAVAAWMGAHAPADSRVVADRYVSQQVGSWAGRMATLTPSATFPLWDLYMRAEPVRRTMLKGVLDADVRYFVVDARMATTRPRMGFWFVGNEPGAGGSKPFPRAAIDRFNCLPWLNAKYAAGPLTVYEVDAGVLRRTMAGSCGRPQA